MSLTIEKAKDIYDKFKHLEVIFDDKNINSPVESFMGYRFKECKGFIEGWNQAIEKCAEIVDRQLDIESETGGDEELTTARNLILSLKVNGGK